MKTTLKLSICDKTGVDHPTVKFTENKAVVKWTQPPTDHPMYIPATLVWKFDINEWTKGYDRIVGLIYNAVCDNIPAEYHRRVIANQFL